MTAAIKEILRMTTICASLTDRNQMASLKTDGGIQTMGIEIARTPSELINVGSAGQNVENLDPKSM